MQKTQRRTSPAADTAEPTWDVAHLFPAQGAWDEGDYLALNGNYLVEFSNGHLEVLPMPTTSHQLLVAYLYGVLLSFTAGRELGTPLFAALRVRLWRRKYREPDVLFMLKEHASRIGEKFWKGADLVMEIVSGGEEDRHRDLVIKRQEYAKAGIAEYWIVDPKEERITVLRLARKQYVVHGEFSRGTIASSHLLPGFTVNVNDAFSAQRRPRSVEKRLPKPRRQSSR